MKLTKKLCLPGMLLFACVLILIDSGCKKAGNVNPTPGGTDQNNNPIAAKADTDVYVLEDADNSTSIWKNGNNNFLSGLAGQGAKHAFNLTVSGNDFYSVGIAFSTLNGPFKTPVYWKNLNGGITVLSVNSIYGASAHGMAISGSDVYVAGVAAIDHSNNPGDAVYWKNNALTSLADSANYYNSNAWNIAVSGQDVYVCGNIELKNNGGEKAVYWKNGVLHQLSDASFFAQATKIYVQFNDVYVMYNQIKTKGDAVQAHYSKDGVDVQLPTDLDVSYGTDMLIKGNDVYITGYTGHPDSLMGTQVEAVLWKNNIIEKLFDSGANKNAYAGAIAISGNNIYVGGEAGGNFGYWKNGAFMANNGYIAFVNTVTISGIAVLTPTSQ